MSGYRFGKSCSREIKIRYKERVKGHTGLKGYDGSHGGHCGGENSPKFGLKLETSGHP